MLQYIFLPFRYATGAERTVRMCDFALAAERAVLIEARRGCSKMSHFKVQMK